MELFRSDRLLYFWPTAQQSARERVNSTTRFILYACVILYLITRDRRVLVLGALVLSILYYLWTSGRIPEPARGAWDAPTTRPTRDNPMANVLLSDYETNPERPSAAWYPTVRDEVDAQWQFIHPFEKRRDAQRNFYTVASTTIPNDQAGFAQAAYGRPFAPMCKDQGGMACNPDAHNFHFPEVTQMRGGNGR